MTTMAQGRFVSTTIAVDAQLARLSAEAEMMYLKCIPHLDRDGMITGDPIQLLTVISPLRFSQMARSIGAIVDDWVDVGLVIRFPTPAGMALFFKGFLKNQTLRYDRERPSLYPPPPGFIHTANGLRPATDVPWVDSSSEENPGSYPKNPAECPVLPEFQPLGENDARLAANGSSNGTPGSYPKNPAESPFLPESAAQAESEADSASAALNPESAGRAEQADARGRGRETGLSALPAAADQDPERSEAQTLLAEFGVQEPALSRLRDSDPAIVRAWIREARKARGRLRDPCAFVVSRLANGGLPPIVDADDQSYYALKRRYVPDGWEDVVKH